MTVRANTIANYAGQGWTALMALIFVPAYIHLLGIEAFALVGFFTMLQTWLSLLDLGLMPTAVREMARFSAGASSAEQVRDLLRSFEVICGGIALAVAAAIFGLSGPIASHWLQVQALPQPSVAQAVALMGVVLGGRLIEGLYRSCLIGLQRQVWLNVATATLATLRALGALAILTWLDRSIAAFFIWQAAVSLLTIAVLGAALYGHLPVTSQRARFSADALRTVARFAIGVMGINLLALSLTQTDKLILSRLLPLDEFGYYMVAATVAGVLYSFIVPLTQAFYPAMVKQTAPEASAELARTFHTGSQTAAVILGPVALVLIAFPHELLFAWSGDRALADAAAPLTAFLAVGTLFNTLMHMPYFLQLAHGWTRLSMFANLLAAAILVPALLWFVPREGAVAAAAIWAVLNLFYLLIVAPLMFRRLLPSEKGRWYLGDLIKPLMLTALAVLAVRLIPLDPETGRIAQALHACLAGALGLAAGVLGADLLRARTWRGAFRSS